MNDIKETYFPTDEYQKIYEEIEEFLPDKMQKQRLYDDLSQLLFWHHEHTKELEYGPTPAEVEKLLEKYEANIKSLIGETLKLYPAVVDDETGRQCDQIPEWLSPCFDQLQDIANREHTGKVQIFLENIRVFRNGKKPRLFARKYWVLELKKIYEKHTGQKARANKNNDYDTHFTKFVLAFYAFLRAKQITKEPLTNENIYDLLKIKK